MDTLKLLLDADIPDLPEEEIKITRLSKICKGDVIFRLRALPYNRADEIIRGQKEDMNVHILLAGVVSPNLKDADLLTKYNAVTPAELVKKMLLPGEIEDISRSVEMLSGYRISTIETVEDVKKN